MIMEHRIETLISAEDLSSRISALGKLISAHYRDSESIALVGLLRGSCVFLADLSRQITVPVTFDFMTASSYGSSMQSNRDVRILKDLDDDIKGRDVLIVEDIIDTGFTLSKVRQILELREPKSLAICTLLDKPGRREVQVPVDWVGFAIPDEFVVGCGIDYAQKYRNLPFIGKVVPL